MKVMPSYRSAPFAPQHQKQTSSPPRRQIEMNPARTRSEHWNFRATASVE